MKPLRTLARRADGFPAKLAFPPDRTGTSCPLFPQAYLAAPQTPRRALSCFTEEVQASYSSHTAPTCLLPSPSSLPASRWIRSCAFASVKGRAVLLCPQLARTGAARVFSTCLPPVRPEPSSSCAPGPSSGLVLVRVRRGTQLSRGGQDSGAYARDQQLCTTPDLVPPTFSWQNFVSEGSRVFIGIFRRRLLSPQMSNCLWTMLAPD